MSNPVVAEIDIFPIEPERQQLLLDGLIEYVETVLKHQPGFVSGTVHRSCDGLRVINYVQWKNPAAYEACMGNQEVASLSRRFACFPQPDSHLYEIFIDEPEGTQLQPFPKMKGLINFGIFKMKSSTNQPRFVELAIVAINMVSGQTGLISTHFHRSLDGERCINYGHWRTQSDFTAMDTNRPFAGPFVEMMQLADNEYQKTLHEVVFTTPVD